jgi:photosystem II stability/assembly factor-like uncharacterized protein
MMPAKAVLCVALAAPFCGMLRAQWRALGPFGGSAAVVQVDPLDSNNVIAGARNAQLYRSRDGGATWEPLQFSLQLNSVLHVLAIVPRIPRVYLAGLSYESPGASGMLRSTDGGTTWSPVPAFSGLQVRAIAMSRGDRPVIAAGTDAGVFESIDGGDSWSRISPPENRELSPVVSLAFDPNNTKTIYVGTPHLPWKTSDGGVTWRSIHAGMVDDSDVFSMVVDRNHPERVFASACSGVYRSVNGGLAWAKLPMAKEASFRSYVVAQDPQFERVLFAGTTHGMIRSRNGGATWERIAPYATRSIAFDLHRLGRIFIATDEAGILRSENYGATWKRVNHGFCNRQLSPLAMSETGVLYTSTIYDPGGGGLFRLANGEDVWSKIASESQLSGEPVLAVMPASDSGDTLYATTPRFIFVSKNGGGAWTRLASFGEAPRLADLFASARTASRVVALPESSLFLAPDVDRTWKTSRDPAGVAIRSLVELDWPSIAALTASDMFLSNDGETWRACARVPGGVEVHGVAALSGHGLLVATSGGLRISANFGASWRTLGGPLEGNTVQAICRHPLRLSTLFAARYGLIYASPDSGRSWIRISPEEWPVRSVKQLVVAPGTPDRLLVLTHQQGVFMLPLDPVVEGRITMRGEPAEAPRGGANPF